MTSRYIVKCNSSIATHDSYESATTAWKRIALAAEDGRSIVAELWRHTEHKWDALWVEGLKDLETGLIDPELFTVIPGKLVISKECIAALTYP